LTPGGPADRCGQLQVGDQILAVNGVDISAMQHHEVVAIIRSSPDLRLVLTVANPPPMTSQHPASPGDDGRLELVELVRGMRGFGFSIRGGREFGDMPLMVLKIADGGAAHGDGRLRVGEIVM
jgi:atrophin-1 interacting protein 3 (BAI1-associated protein 1)